MISMLIQEDSHSLCSRKVCLNQGAVRRGMPMFREGVKTGGRKNKSVWYGDIHAHGSLEAFAKVLKELLAACRNVRTSTVCHSVSVTRTLLRAAQYAIA